MTAQNRRLAGPGKLFLLVLLSAGLTFAAAQFPRLWFLSFGSLYPLVYALLQNGLSDIPLGKRLVAGAGLGLVFGFAYFSACLYWMWRFMPGLNFITGLFQGSFFCLFGLLSPFFTRRFSFCLAGLPCLWVACEFLRGAGPFGFCWYSIANIQASNLPLLQYASLLGCRVIDFLVLFLVCAFALFFTDKSKPHRLFALGAAVLFAAIQTGGELFILPLEGADKTVKLIQANMDPEKKTDPEAISEHILMTRKNPKADLVIWPETTVSMLSLSDRVSIGMAAAQASAPIITGANVPREDNYTNSAVMFSAKGKKTGQYDKCRLVPFGEYTPFRRFFKKAPNPRLQSWEALPGQNRAALLKSGPFRVGVTVCYESSFWQPAAKQARAGANLLAVVVNDGWLGRSNAPYTHLQFARLRAAENRRWYLRSASSGISAVISPYGQIVKWAPSGRKRTLVAPFGFETRKTLFTRTGDILGPLCAAAALLFAVLGAVFEYRGNYHL